MGSIAALVLLCITTGALGQVTLTSDGCYREYTNSKVNCMTSFMSQTVNSIEECGQLCTKNAPKCKAAQMAPFPDSTCQLFDAAVPVTPSTGRKRRLAGCYGYGPSLIYSQGSCYLLPNGYGCNSGAASTLGPQTPPTPPTLPTQLQTQPTPPAPSTTTTVATVPTDAPTMSAVQTTVATTISDSQVPPEATCPEGKSVRYTYVEGYKLTGQPDFTFQAPTEQDCMTACTNNRSPDGKQAPCRSADYNSKTQQCQISLHITPPLGPTKAEANADFKHFEKVCVDATIATNCPGAYFRAPQHIVVGFAQAVSTATSTADCLEQCANAQTRFNFVCSSGMYYFDETVNNCILNSESRATNPDLFIAENSDSVEYFEPGCTGTGAAASKRSRQGRQAGPPKRNRNILRLNTDTFPAWTMCDTIQLTHMRFRQCTTLNPNKCQIDLNGCDPAKEDQYDREVNATASIGNATQQESKKRPSTPRHTTPTPTPTPTPKASSTPPVKKGTTPRVTTPPTTPPPTTPKPGPSECVPLIVDGRRDCRNGVRIMPNGRKEPCILPKNFCDDKDRGRDTRG